MFCSYTSLFKSSEVSIWKEIRYCEAVHFCCLIVVLIYCHFVSCLCNFFVVSPSCTCSLFYLVSSIVFIYHWIKIILHLVKNIGSKKKLDSIWCRLFFFSSCSWGTHTVKTEDNSWKHTTAHPYYSHDDVILSQNICTSLNHWLNDRLWISQEERLDSLLTWSSYLNPLRSGYIAIRSLMKMGSQLRVATTYRYLHLMHQLAREWIFGLSPINVKRNLQVVI